MSADDWHCPVCDGPMVVVVGSDSRTPVGKRCALHGVVSAVLPELTTIDLAQTPPERHPRLTRLGYAPNGQPLPEAALPDDHPRRNPGAVAAARAAKPDRL